jgi:hypothetical protein
VDGSRCLLTRPRLARNSELIRDDILANRYCAIIPLEEESMRREVLIDISPFTTRFQPNRFDPRACGGEGKRTNLNELLTCRFGWKGPTAARTKARTPARLDLLLLLLLMPPVFGMGWDGISARAPRRDVFFFLPLRDVWKPGSEASGRGEEGEDDDEFRFVTFTLPAGPTCRAFPSGLTGPN